MARSAPGDDATDGALQGLVEEFGLWFHRQGLPRMAGRILGFLLVCDPPEQTMQEIADHLQASMGSISTLTRMLEERALLERVSIPGERRVRYRVRPYAFANSWEEQLASATSLQQLVDRALSTLDEAEPGRRERLTITRQFTSFYIEQLPRLIAGWRAELEARPATGRRRRRSSSR